MFTLGLLEPIACYSPDNHEGAMCVACVTNNILGNFKIMTKRMIVLNTSGAYESVLLPVGAFTSALVDQRLVITSPIDFGPYGTVVSGDTGRVTFVDQNTGEIEILVDRFIPKMRPWGNAFIIMPFESDAIIATLRHVPFVNKFFDVPSSFTSQGSKACS